MTEGKPLLGRVKKQGAKNERPWWYMDVGHKFFLKKAPSKIS